MGCEGMWVTCSITLFRGNVNFCWILPFLDPKDIRKTGLFQIITGDCAISKVDFGLAYGVKRGKAFFTNLRIIAWHTIEPLPPEG